MDLKTQAFKVWLPLQKWFVVLLVMASAVTCAQVTWLWLVPAKAVVAPIIKAENGSQKNAGTNWLQIAKQVSRREFFGEVAVEASTVVADVPADAPDTALNLTLQGLMARGDGKGFAVISQRNGVGKTFGVGDDLFGQANLQSVFGDRVIIDRRGEFETLRYEKRDVSGILQPVVETAKSNDNDTFQQVLEEANRQVSQGADVQSQVQGMVEYVQRKANEDPEAFVKEMGLQATDGGYQVTRRARQLQMVGLRPGDVVTAVNDTPVGNIQTDQALLNQVLQTGGELKIQIQRGSRSFTIYQSIPTY